MDTDLPRLTEAVRRLEVVVDDVDVLVLDDDEALAVDVKLFVVVVQTGRPLQEKRVELVHPVRKGALHIDSDSKLPFNMLTYMYIV